MWAIVIEDQIDAPEQFLERNVLHRLGMLRQVAGRAVEIATLRDLERDAADRPATTHELIFGPLAGGNDVSPRFAERMMVAGRPRRGLGEVDFVWCQICAR
jgi:hypothetical protein